MLFALSGLSSCTSPHRETDDFGDRRQCTLQAFVCCLVLHAPVIETYHVQVWMVNSSISIFSNLQLPSSCGSHFSTDLTVTTDVQTAVIDGDYVV